jgi:hypothetical protein
MHSLFDDYVRVDNDVVSDGAPMAQYREWAYAHPAADVFSLDESMRANHGRNETTIRVRSAGLFGVW